MHSLTSVLVILYMFNVYQTVTAFEGIPGLYCGLESCYDVLGATRESSKEDITKLYRSLARKWHPDRFIQKSKEEKDSATERFRAIATAYEVLKEDESRRDYDDMMDNPENYYRHYYRYYRRVYGTKVDARIVIIGLISLISAYQYWVMHSRYNDAIDYFVTVPKYRFRAQDIARQEGLLPISTTVAHSDKSGTKKRKERRTKEEMKEAEEAVIRKVIENNMDIRGGLSKPDIKNILWIQLLMLPYTIYLYIRWHIRWVILFDIKGEPYGREEKIYLIRKNMGVTQEHLDTNEDVESLLRQELWIKDKFLRWKQKRAEEMKEKLAESSGYKRYRRYMKKGGPGQITFLED
ncbi:DnaJ-like subfamily C member 25, partial [Fragariocoptes setiger]